MISNSQSFNEYIEDLAEQYEQTEVQQGKILSEIREAYHAQGKDGGGWLLFIKERLNIEKNTAYRLIDKSQIVDDFFPHEGTSVDPTQREVETLTSFKREEPDLYKEVLETKPTLEQMLEVARAEQAAFEADTAAHEKLKQIAEDTRQDPSEDIANKIMSIALVLSLPHNEDKVTSYTLVNELKKKTITPHDEIALSMFRMKLNSTLDMIGID